MAVGRWTRRYAIAQATLVAGTLDIAAALLLAHLPPQRLLQTIASAVVGDHAFAGGWASAALGLAVHYLLALAMVALFVTQLSARRPVRRRPFVAGALYGAALWAVMYLIVLPLRWPDRYPDLAPAATAAELLCHILLVGLPIGWATSRLRRTNLRR